LSTLSRVYFRTAVLFLLAGITMGLQMAITHDHSAMAAHAHVNLLGWVSSAIFGIYYAFNPAKAERRLAWLQYGAYTIGLIIMLPALFLMLRGNAALEPVVAIGSLITAAAILLFAVILFMPEPSVAAKTGPARAPAE
jgi:peptidoglycan/LPS O-acetylase OafA/YrhL